MDQPTARQEPPCPQDPRGTPEDSTGSKSHWCPLGLCVNLVFTVYLPCFMTIMQSKNRHTVVKWVSHIYLYISNDLVLLWWLYKLRSLVVFCVYLLEEGGFFAVDLTVSRLVTHKRNAESSRVWKDWNFYCDTGTAAEASNEQELEIGRAVAGSFSELGL